MESELTGTATKTRPVKVQVDEETSIIVEARVLPGETNVKGGNQLQQFENVAKTIEKVTQMLTQAWKAAGPSRASVELNIEFAWESGELLAMFVQGSTAASLKISLEWEKSHLERADR
ncbi:MAG TPA: CU044_2847 family protein [Ktedonobacteraceae bacterium]|nr:CU044_2847 family protein [Ktedonobacteraceae bacterium]